MCGGRGLTAEERPHTVDEFRTYTKSLHHSDATPNWIYEMYDILEAHEEECKPWYAVVHPGKLSYIKYHEAEKGALPSNWVAIGDSTIKLNPIYGKLLEFLLAHQPLSQSTVFFVGFCMCRSRMW